MTAPLVQAGGTGAGPPLQPAPAEGGWAPRGAAAGPLVGAGLGAEGGSGDPGCGSEGTEGVVWVARGRATRPPFFFRLGSVASVVRKWRKFPPARRVERSAVIAMSWTSGGGGLAGLGVPPWPS